MSKIDDVENICILRLQSEGFNKDTKYTSRLNSEIEDLGKWEKHGDSKASWILKEIGKEGYPVASNKSNSLILFLTKLSSIDPIVNTKQCIKITLVSGSCPDIDTDFDPRIRGWVKEHIIEMFGEDHVCSICTYQTYRTKAVILDVVRALNEDLNVANEVTKKIDSLDSFENDEGEEKRVDKLSFKELREHYPELDTYFKAHPTVLHHSEILRNQIKNRGTHAGGVIISDINLKGRIPVLYDKPSSEDRQIVSAWSEAGGNEELSSVGLVKFDILGLNNLPIISDCIKLVKANRGIEIKRYDIPIDDSKTIKDASKKDLVGIFQLDNPSTKSVADEVEMESLDDVAAVTSLIRPGPRDMGMDRMYAKRKHGEPYAMPNILRNILAETHGVITYQEQAMKIAQVLAGFAPTKSYKFLKAIAKKQKDLMDSFKAEFIAGSQAHVVTGEITSEEVNDIWDLLAAFAEYAFNKSVDIHSSVWCNGSQKEIGEVVAGDIVLCFDGTGMVETEVVANHDHGILPAYEVTFEGGRKTVCSINHKFETAQGKIPLWRMIKDNNEVLCADGIKQLEVSDLSENITDEKGTGKSSKKHGTFVQWSPTNEQLFRVRVDYQGNPSVAKTSGEMSTSDFDFQCKSDFGESGKRFDKKRQSLDWKSKRTSDRYGQEGGFDAACQESSLRQYEGIECVPSLQGKGKNDILANSTKDFNATRYNKETVCCSEKVERRTSRRIQGNLSESEKSNQELESRNMVVGKRIRPKCVQEESSSSVFKHGQGNRFCWQKHLDRSGWLLALRNRFHKKKIFASTNSRKGYFTQQRSWNQKCDADSTRIGLLAGQRSLQVKTRMDGRVEENDTTQQIGGVSLRRMLSARFVGFRHMCDLEVSHPSHNFALANGVITSNSHAISYSAISTVELWLKHHHQSEYITSLINNSEQGKKKHGQDVFIGNINYARRSGVEILSPDVSRSSAEFKICGNKVLFSLGHVRNVASQAEVIVKFQPFKSIEDFYNRVKVESVNSKGKTTFKRPNKKVVETLIEAGAFDEFAPAGKVSEKRNALMVEYYRVRDGKKEAPPQHDDVDWITLEQEAVGICLSQPPLFRQYEDLIRLKGWKLICELQDKKKVTVFGVIESITPRTSKTGNPMYMVEISDGLDKLTFFVFKGCQQLFKDNFKIGMIVALPLAKFDDGDMRFYDDHRDFEIIPKSKASVILPPAPKKSDVRFITKFSNGDSLEYDWGKWDPWYVYETKNGTRGNSGRDVDYLNIILELGRKYGNKVIYDEFVKLYDMTINVIDPILKRYHTERKVLDYILTVAQRFKKDAFTLERIFSILYAAMISEENKENCRLGKRVKRLGVYQVLIKGDTPEVAADFSRVERTKSFHRYV